MKKGRQYIKSIISYIVTLILTVFFALFLNAKVGWFMLVALILAPGASVFFAFLSTFFVSFEGEMENCLLSKGDKCSMTIKIRNEFLFPTPPIEITMRESYGVRAIDETILVSLLPFQRKTMTVDFIAGICGPGEIGIGKVKVTDYLGLVAFKAGKKQWNKVIGKVAVIPNIEDVSLKDDKILKVLQVSNQAEDGDDTLEISSNTFGGFPGCDNREYVPGDPLKRINWKQSAKYGKLLVRLDDVLAMKKVNLVLDSTFIQEKIPVDILKNMTEYSEQKKELILAKIGEEAIEKALGIIGSLVLSGYSINFYLAKGAEYEKYLAEDEKDIENLKVLLADYEYDCSGEKERIPKAEILDVNSTFMFCTPNDYKEIYDSVIIKRTGFVSVFSVMGDKNIGEYKQEKRKPKKKKREELPHSVKAMVIPYLLALLSGTTMFSLFGVPFFSGWTVFQGLVCAFVFWLCSLAKKRKIYGVAGVVGVIVVALMYFSSVAFQGITYMQWFMSAADTIENTFSYLTTLIAIFTLLFAMVLFYYTQVFYRTSSVLFVTLMPYVVAVKQMKEVGTGYVISAIVLNVAAFLIHSRRHRDKGKRIEGYFSGILSLMVYAVCFVSIALAVPKGEETKYYHFFEEWFLGGNTSIPLPEEYGDQNEYSGNADDFNQRTNRQLYVIERADFSSPLYLRRQVFDYYDFENDRWYYNKEYATYETESLNNVENSRNLKNSLLLEAMYAAEELSPGFLEKYGLSELDSGAFTETTNVIEIITRNFDSYYLITPTKTLEVYTHERWNEAYMNRHGVYGREWASFGRYMSYSVRYISQFETRESWIGMGGSDIDYDLAHQMLAEMVEILSDSDKYQEHIVAKAFYEESKFAGEYEKSYENNNKEIPEKVKELALDITRDCTYEWEKAKALENYFQTAGFTYDLEYVSPDNSVEYFLFEGKTGTCSDFASAYVLMARAAGLKARYVEGFVPSREISADYEWQYVVRTKSSHAYPEVYIPNLGFVVFEPTVGNIGGMDVNTNRGIVSYISAIIFSVVAILAAVAFLIVFVLVVVRIIFPVVSEKIFLSKVAKTENDKAVIMLYRRILDKYSKPQIKNAVYNTPYELAGEFEKVYGCDISSFTYLVERIAYKKCVVTESEKFNAMQTYMKIKKMHKEKKRRRAYEK